jgi:hypothetical protein
MLRNLDQEMDRYGILPWGYAGKTVESRLGA